MKTSKLRSRYRRLNDNFYEQKRCLEYYRTENSYLEQIIEKKKSEALSLQEHNQEPKRIVLMLLEGNLPLYTDIRSLLCSTIRENISLSKRNLDNDELPF